MFWRLKTLTKRENYNLSKLNIFRQKKSDSIRFKCSTRLVCLLSISLRNIIFISRIVFIRKILQRHTNWINSLSLAFELICLASVVVSERKCNAARKIIRSAIHINHKLTARRKRSSIFIKADIEARAFVTSSTSFRIERCVTPRDDFSSTSITQACMNVVRRTCHLSNASRLRSKCTDILRQPRPRPAILLLLRITDLCLLRKVSSRNYHPFFFTYKHPASIFSFTTHANSCGRHVFRTNL